MHAAVGHEVVGDGFCRVDRNGKADSGGSAGGRVNRGIDADDLAVRIDERPAGIAAIDGGVGLNGFVDKSRLTSLHGAAKRADDAGGEGGLKAERISDS